MIQSFDTQLQVILRALREVVAPALPSENRQVQEQLALSIAGLEFMRARLPLARACLRADLNDYISLARQAAEIVGSGGVVESSTLTELALAGEREHGRPAASDEDLLLATRELREGLSSAVRDARGAAHEATLSSLIIGASDGLLLRERLWSQPFGFELTPDKLETQPWLS